MQLRPPAGSSTLRMAAARRPVPIEQSALGQPVVGHAAVVVQMVLREVGEDGRVECCVPSSRCLGEANGRGLDGAGTEALCIGKLPAKARCSQHRVGRGHAGGLQAPGRHSTCPKCPPAHIDPSPDCSSFDSAFRAPASHQVPCWSCRWFPSPPAPGGACAGLRQTIAAAMVAGGRLEAVQRGNVVARKVESLARPPAPPGRRWRRAPGRRRTCARPSVAAPGQAMKPSPGVMLAAVGVQGAGHTRAQPVHSVAGGMQGVQG
jgi:hypothetical protein